MYLRNSRLLFSVALLAGIALAAPVRSFAADPPAWLREMARAPVAPQGPSIPAVILVNDQRVTIEDDGRIVTNTSYAVRILTRSGRAAASGTEVYRTDSGKVRDLRAWLIPATGNTREYDNRQAADLALVNNDIYNEARIKRISAVDEAQPGAVFGYEAISEDRAIFTQFEFPFQSGLPTLRSRFFLTVPAGWRVESVTFNHAPIKPEISNGTTYIWQLDNLPSIDEEPASPELSSIVARVAVSVFPPAGSRAAVSTFGSWQDVSKWLSELNDPQVILSDAVVEKARALTAGATDDYSRIAAIAKFVQGIQYVSIQTGIGRGGGYKPHTSAEVLVKAYGDCKDKANLMRAMLKVIGITAYPVAIYSGDPDYVREEWPSPQQFNHAVVAIAFSSDKAQSSAVQHSSLGALTIFDPTDPETPFGQLPDHEQGSFALIVAGERGAIMKMPATSPESNRLERDVQATLDAAGSLVATIRESTVGHAAVTARREFRGMSISDYESLIAGWVIRSVNNAKVGNILPKDDDSAGTFTLQLDLAAPRYGQLMQNRLLVFKPVVVSRRASTFLTEPSRKYPILLSSQAYTERVNIKLPAGFQVDELPDPVKLETPFGAYSVNYAAENGALLMTRSFTLRRSTIPVEQYASVRAFYERILAAEQAPAVLIRK